MENGKLGFGVTYRVFYTDDTGNKRDKTLRLDSSDDVMYFFFNPLSKKIEAIPKRIIHRMEEAK